MAPGEYTSMGAGKLRLKGVKDSKVEKKKKKKDKAKSSEQVEGEGQRKSHDAEDAKFQDKSVMLKKLEDEDEMVRREQVDGPEGESTNKKEVERTGLESEVVKTEAERRYQEQRRRRLEERLKREGVKTHKERVEELNRYLSSLSEHHDMPKIGPG
ncbi:hypothetical protein B0A52_07665 [Exophiala mesophila]|uniref:DUF1754-domain-containing protein n=1 Tax=Exophiala mesophila TaxID=212818 RepID=A0A438MYI1_EXOME|nr:hypothetical protein B0A52_07665 [Exophiala mesophila]